MRLKSKMLGMGAVTLALLAVPLGVLTPIPASATSSQCISVDSTYWSEATGPSPANTYYQTHDLTYYICATRTSSSNISVNWSWQTHNNAKVLDSVVALYTWSCTTGTASPGKATMSYPNGTSLTFGSGTTNFAVTPGTSYAVGFSGTGHMSDPRYIPVQHFAAAAPSNIIPFAARTDCLHL